FTRGCCCPDRTQGRRALGAADPPTGMSCRPRLAPQTRERECRWTAVRSLRFSPGVVPPCVLSIRSCLSCLQLLQPFLRHFHPPERRVRASRIAFPVPVRSP